MKEIKTSLLLGYQCNNNCKFCYCGDKREDMSDKYRPMSTEKAKKELENGRERGSKWVDFLGGEPTIRNDIIELISYAKQIGYETVSITTNGKMLSYREFAEKIIDAGLNHAIFSLHSHKPEMHNYLVQSEGTFNKLEKGINNVKDIYPDIYICINTVILQQNYEDLPKIPERAYNMSPTGLEGIEFIFPHPRGNAWKNFEEMVPRLGNIYNPVNDALKKAKRSGFKHIEGRYIPFCYMLGNEIFISESKQSGRMKEQHVGPEFEDLNVEQGRREVGKVKAQQCEACKYYKRCEGIWQEYAEKRGTEELIPVP